VAVGPDGGGVVAGYFHNTLDFAPPLLTSTGGADAFVAKFAP
jgi:hypothetical protein